MDFFLFALAILLLFPSRFSWRRGNDGYISKDGIQPIKGLFLLLVFASHFMQGVRLAGPYEQLYAWVRFHMGQLIVVPFFFYSGFGVISSISSKGESYLRSMPVRRMLRLLFQFDLVVLLFLLEMTAFGRHFGIGQVFGALFTWSSLGNSNWYITAILLLYAISYCSFTAVEGISERARPWTALALISLMTVLMSTVIGRYHPAYCHNTIFAYVAGCWFYMLRPQFEKLVKSSHGYLMLLALFAAGTWLLFDFRKITFWHQLFSICFAMTVMMITMKLECRNPLLAYCGRHLFSLYILQRLPMHVFGMLPWMRSHVYLYFLASLAVTLLISAWFDRVFPKIWNYVAETCGGMREENRGIEMSPTLSGKLCHFGLLSIVMVVFIHCNAPSKCGEPGWWFWAIWTAGLCRVSVPFFFLVSGLFIGRHLGEPGWWMRENGKRAFSLAVPYLIWAVLYGVLLSTCCNVPVNGWTRLWRVLGLDFLRWPEMVPLWYVRSLMLFVLTLPVVLLRNRIALLVEIFVLFTLSVLMHGSYFRWNDAVRFFTATYSLWGLAFFLTGVWLARFGRGLVIRRPVALVALAVGLGLIWATIVAMRSAWPHATAIRYFSVPFLLVGMWGLIPPFPVPAAVKGMVFPIFLMHMGLLRICRGMFGITAKMTSVEWVLLQFGFAVLLSAGFTLLLRRFFPKTSGWLFGGR